ncbi:hypothetical protein A1D22_11255 [Pasteurellaceae bacterium LFhippo2]|nr:hypothetical protein [Pasteurellaceae bacterium LFhippo2]
MLNFLPQAGESVSHLTLSHLWERDSFEQNNVFAKSRERAMAERVEAERGLMQRMKAFVD